MMINYLTVQATDQSQS